MNLHLVALPHVTVQPSSCGCAYTSKVLKFTKIFPTTLYAPEGPSVLNTTLVPCLSDEARIKTFGADDPNRLPAWPTEEQTKEFNKRVIDELKIRVKPDDLILLVGGYTHKPIADAFSNQLLCEPFIGYEGTLMGSIWGAYESYFHMAQVYKKHNVNDIRWFDRVIPPFYDPADFPILNDGKGDYLLFLGRLIQRKGPHIASEIARASGMALKVAGAGGKQVGTDIVADEITVKDAKYVGPVGIEDRAKLLAGARAVLFPTTYAEPGGNVAIEAMACGTPVIASDFGVAAETVKEGMSGYRFRLLRDAVKAVEDCSNLDPEMIKNHAFSNYSLSAIKPKFLRWFADIESLTGKGWYAA